MVFKLELPRVPKDSYYDKYKRPTAALYRARQPFLIRNALTGLCIVGFVAGVYSFTIRAIGQDDFKDIPMPDSPVQTGAIVGSTPSSAPQKR